MNTENKNQISSTIENPKNNVKTIICKNCKTEFSGQNFCPNCGKKTKKSKKLLIILIIIPLILILSLFLMEYFIRLDTINDYKKEINGLYITSEIIQLNFPYTLIISAKFDDKYVTVFTEIVKGSSEFIVYEEIGKWEYKVTDIKTVNINNIDYILYVEEDTVSITPWNLEEDPKLSPGFPATEGLNHSALWKYRKDVYPDEKIMYQ